MGGERDGESLGLFDSAFLGRTIVPWTVGAVFAVIFFHPKHIPAQGLNVCPSIPFSHSCRKENTIFLPLAVAIKDSLGDFLLPFASLPCVFPLAAICSSAVMLKALPGELRLHLPFRASTHLEIIMETLLLYTSPTKIQAVLGENQDSVLWIHLILSCGEQRGIFIDLKNQILLSSFQINSNIWLFCPVWLFRGILACHKPL